MNHYVLGNGLLLLNYDAHANLTDLYYPYVGHPNHVGGQRCGVGVVRDGRFRWLDASWRPEGGYLPGGLVARNRYHHPEGGLTLTLHQSVHPSQPALLVGVSAENHTGQPVRVEICFYHNFRLNEHNVGDTACHHPAAPGLIHYKESVFLLAAGRNSDGSWADRWHIGRRDGSEKPSWQAMQEQALEQIPIRQGDVDSALQLRLDCPARGGADADYYLVAGRALPEVIARFHALRDAPLPQLQEQGQLYWQAWTARAKPRAAGLATLPPAWRAAYERSLLLVRTQIDHAGGILAANDTAILAFNRDHYSYVWPRDGALVARALLHQGYADLARRYLEFFGRILSPEGYALHKFRPDGTLGSSWHPWIQDGRPALPIQEDETALPLALLGDYLDTTEDLEFVDAAWRAWAERAARFLVAHRDPVDDLPLPSYDLWEERLGVHGFTVAAVVAGLRAAVRISRALGHFGPAEDFAEAAEKMASGFDRHFWSASEGAYARCRFPDGRFDFTADAADHALLDLGLRPPGCPRIHKHLSSVWRRLLVHAPGGGVARYERDYYHRVTEDYARVTGNPWVISTLWCAAWLRRSGRTDDAAALIETVLARQNAFGLLPEQWHPETGAPLSVSPLTWSHAVLVETLGNW
jgi:GH15 family glucan-1,4-alpha-glucosidase